jgi:hypothetical protein
VKKRRKKRDFLETEEKAGSAPEQRIRRLAAHQRGQEATTSSAAKCL